MRLFLIILGGLSLANGIFQFRVMTMSTWKCGRDVENGPLKIARHMEMSIADVVVLQLMQADGCVASVLQYLKQRWTHSRVTPRGLVIFTKLHSMHFEYHSDKIIYARLLVPNHDAVDIFAIDADETEYGPYGVWREQPDLRKILEGEKIRKDDVQKLLTYIHSRYMPDRRSVIIAGTLTTPSHQDWIVGNADIHNGKVIEWPATMMLTKAGFADAFRELHPDPIKKPGITWSTCVKSNALSRPYPIQEPYDRIDYIYYQQGVNQIIKPIKSETYAGTDKIEMEPNQKMNNWPSNHYAVITDFVFFSQTGSDTSARVNDLWNE